MEKKFKNNLLLNYRSKLQLDSFIEAPLHALILIGQEGSGKRTVSEFVASKLLHISNQSLEDYPYITILDAAHGNSAGIEEIRGLAEFLRLKVPGKAFPRRIVIIYEIGNLGHEAQNALLKTLEEPPDDTVIIMTTSDIGNVLATIRSRAQELRLLPVTYDQVSKYYAKYNQNDLKQKYFISGGLVGYLDRLISESEHIDSLTESLMEAKRLLMLPRYKRMCEVDKLSKDKKRDHLLLTTSMAKLLEASLKTALANDASEKEMKTRMDRLNLCVAAVSKAKQKIHPKLIYSQLFFHL